MDTPTLQQLRYAVAVADLGHVGRAAERCFVSQPALSKQLMALEARLGTTLFERSNRGVVITPSGERLVAQARRVLNEVDTLMAFAREEGDGLDGRLHLGVIPTIGPYLLPDALVQLRATHPTLQLVLREDQTERLLDRLGDGRLDAAVVALPLTHPGFATETLYEEQFLLAAPLGHPLAGDDGPVTDADLVGHRLILLEEGHCLRDQALAVCRQAGAGAAEISGTSLGTVVQMVANGLGVTLLPERALDIEVRVDDPIVLRRFVTAPSRTVALAWRASSPRGEAFVALADALRECQSQIHDHHESVVNAA